MDVAEPLYLEVLADADAAEPGHPPDIVPREIHEHVVLGKLLFVEEELLLVGLVPRISGVRSLLLMSAVV